MCAPFRRSMTYAVGRKYVPPLGTAGDFYPLGLGRRKASSISGAGRRLLSRHLVGP